MRLTKEFYQQADVTHVARELLGKVLCTQSAEGITKGIIVETEAYCGATDKACHAFLNKRTSRTEIMFQEGGMVYTYLCYGIHTLFNIVTNQKDQADAVLIRAVEPLEGLDLMASRRNMPSSNKRLTAGPGCLTKALGIDLTMNGIDLMSTIIWIEDQAIDIPETKILAGPRVGIAYAEEDALLPWRFQINGNSWCSKPKVAKYSFD